jgi:hypothetical protein
VFVPKLEAEFCLQVFGYSKSLEAKMYTNLRRGDFVDYSDWCVDMARLGEYASAGQQPRTCLIVVRLC